MSASRSIRPVLQMSTAEHALAVLGIAPISAGDVPRERNLARCATRLRRPRGCRDDEYDLRAEDVAA